ncbi:PREDICTED: uncharacterized protein LOC104812306 isoform X3 [Tarenaya hassleriana]|nr:PREDICTED: uncharacterized protein LOC104812306 isoform X3 [Tarenaya hassleriana]XP_010537702.1 PREDICTED: uncharacterized protein LOC104812306 isoform X3 [Tarenaya hassleriana]XP_010537703.1 PREDICTED: uncharacterized protein LOC104812306 isoform X3 [Tarenaya hassleriana]XP_010537704.1 PREDICTED: uncharacterized protein LOC104812306 isoform X3 [Tarenaya hassleriana]XP_010537707.1 PREDICTED: uncharacterized protein LOC104812306 isoform X3 [Tarenaya hassleriana]XP_010537708.1 PREDICTED: unch
MPYYINETLEFPCEILGAAAAVVILAKILMYFAGSDGSIYKWSVKRNLTGENCSCLIHLNSKHKTLVVSVAISDDGKTMVSAAEDGSLFIWDTETDERKAGFRDNVNGSSISDMLITSVTSNSRHGYCGEASSDVNSREVSTQNVIGMELYGKMLKGEIEEEAELENVMMVADIDECKAIDMLEAAIDAYEKLLELLLKEARRESKQTRGRG